VAEALDAAFEGLHIATGGTMSPAIVGVTTTIWLDVSLSR
jgi:hypothetical protein